ncbi:MAG: radical SAM family heme chaperone HemW [Elusimicrobiales bacterium]|nr:radical SAM family heme chaperone HemW [Elusimicrobiales bacterium]
MTGLYIHIPFCSGKCKYCDFVSFEGKEALHSQYVGAVSREMKMYAGMTFETLYIGGGTPSELSTANLKKLLLAVQEYFIRVREFAESTVEVNPESISRDKIILLHQFGMNRVSMGLQSFDDAVLKSLGRRHDAARFLSTFRDLRAVGFKNISVDLIAGIPWQGRESFAETLSKTISLSPEHVSVYGLEIGDASKFAGEGVQPDEDLARDNLETARAALEAAGYVHYEISNFAKPGFECRHNLNYWDNGEYVGVGCAATSYQGGIRKTNAPLLEHYCDAAFEDENLPLASCEKLAGKEKTGETLMLGLRKLSGLRLTDEMLLDFGAELSKLEKRGFITLTDGTAKLTRDGLYLSNEVFRAFVPPF